MHTRRINRGRSVIGPFVDTVTPARFEKGDCFEETPESCYLELIFRNETNNVGLVRILRHRRNFGTPSRKSRDRAKLGR